MEVEPELYVEETEQQGNQDESERMVDEDEHDTDRKNYIAKDDSKKQRMK